MFWIFIVSYCVTLIQHSTDVSGSLVQGIQYHSSVSYVSPSVLIQYGLKYLLCQGCPKQIIYVVMHKESICKNQISSQKLYKVHSLVKE